MTVSLYERTHALALIDEWIAEAGEDIASAGGEIPAHLVELLDAAEGDFKAKAESVALYVRSLQAHAGAVKLEEDRLRARRKALENGADRLKAYLKAQLEATGITRVDGTLATVRIQANPESVRFTDLPANAPEKYQRVTITVDVAAAKADYRATGELPPGFVAERGSHLRIS